MKLRKVEHVLNSENKIYSKLKRSKKNTCFKLTNIQRIEHIQKFKKKIDIIIRYLECVDNDRRGCKSRKSRDRGDNCRDNRRQLG